jgi:hypothetical protein
MTATLIMKARESQMQCPEPELENTNLPQHQIEALHSLVSMMSFVAMGEDENKFHNSARSIITDVHPMDAMSSPPSDRMIKVVDRAESPKMVRDFDDSDPSGHDDDDDAESYNLDASQKSEVTHQSLHEMVTKSLSEIDGVLGEIMNESFSATKPIKVTPVDDDDDDEEDDDDVPAPTTLQAELNNADQEEKHNYKQSVMANVERISSELEETRKGEEELKNRIDKLRAQLAERRALRNRITSANRVVEHNVNTLPTYSKDKPREDKPKPSRESRTEELKENLNNMRTNNRSWLSMFRARRREQQQQEAEAREQEQSKTSREADELLHSFRSRSEEEKNSYSAQQMQIESGRRRRFVKEDSWTSFIPSTRNPY